MKYQLTIEAKHYIVVLLLFLTIGLAYKCITTYNEILTAGHLRIIAARAYGDLFDVTSATVRSEEPVKQKTIVAKVHARLDPYHDPNWATRYEKTGDRTVRYGASTKPFTVDKKFLNWQGKRPIDKDVLENMTRDVLHRMPHIKTTDDTVALVVETMVAESRGGGDSMDEGTGDLGILQIRVVTANDLREWLKFTHEDIYTAVESFRNKEWSTADNLRNNIPYSIALCISDYWRKAGADYYKHISTRLERAIMWKSVYNTKLGVGTVNQFVERNDYYQRSVVASK